MGFDKERKYYLCGCYAEHESHDFFNYTRNDIFVNVCGKHESQTGALEDQKMKEKLSMQRDLIEKARDILVNHIDSDKVIHQLTRGSRTYYPRLSKINYCRLHRSTPGLMNY